MEVIRPDEYHNWWPNENQDFQNKNDIPKTKNPGSMADIFAKKINDGSNIIEDISWKTPEQILSNENLSYENLSNEKVKEFIISNFKTEKPFTDEMFENVKKCISKELTKLWYPVKHVEIGMPPDNKSLEMYVYSDELKAQNKAIAWIVDIFDFKNLEKNYIIQAWDMIESNGGWFLLMPKGKFKIDKIHKDWSIIYGGTSVSDWSSFKKINL